MSSKLVTVTKFTNRFAVKYPIVSAPMGAISGPRLAAAMSNAGCIGFLGTDKTIENNLVSRFLDAEKLALTQDNLGLGLLLACKEDVLKLCPIVAKLNVRNLWLSGTKYFFFHFARVYH